MNVSLVLFLLFLCTCQGEEQGVSTASGILGTIKGQRKVARALEISCPEPTDIEPCECSIQLDLLHMDCSKVQDEEQLRKVFLAAFPSTDFYRLSINQNKGLKVLEDGVFGNVGFQEIVFYQSVLEAVRNDALTPSLSTLTNIDIDSCQLAIFPFERLAEFTSLKKLSLRHNKIHSLTPLSSSSLRYLELSENPISHLSPDVFTLLPAIEKIDLVYSNLTEITPGTFSGLPELYQINLFGNEISYLQSLTFDLFSLPPRSGFLSLQFNKINFVEVDAFKGVQELSAIFMVTNALTTLEERVWRPVLEKDINVLFEDNPLSCGCDVAWLVRNPQLLKLAKDARCANGTLLIHLNPADFDICG